MMSAISVMENTPPGSPLRRRPKAHYEHSPFCSERKRNLFPTASPHGSDLSEITPLSPVKEEFSPSKSKVIVRTPLVPTSVNQNVTPKKTKNLTINDSPRRSPRLAEKQVIKTSSFYGRSLLPQFAKTSPKKQAFKTKLFSEEESNPGKRPASEPLHSRPNKKKCPPKQRTRMFAGVHHAIHKRKPPPPPKIRIKPKPLRAVVKQTFDFSRTPYCVKKDPYCVKKDETNWNYAQIHRERKELEDSEVGKRKFFKSSGKISVITPPSSQKKKCKLFKVKCDELLADPDITASDILDMIEGNAPDKISNNVCYLTESASNLSIDDAVGEADRSLTCETPESELEFEPMSEPEPTPKSKPELQPISEPEPENDSGTKVYPVFNFRNCTPKAASPRRSPRKSGSACKPPKKTWHGLGENQLLIDAGQKKFGATQCPDCGLVYEVGSAEDEIQHSRYHSYHKTLRYPGYKNERIVGRYGLDYIVCFTSLDSKVNMKKILSVMEIVDKELGFDHAAVKILNKTQVYFYVCEKRIVGCLVAEPLSAAYRMLIDESDVDVCSDETYPVKCGISRIWTLATNRRQGIATKLLDCLRRNFFYGSILAQEHMAFSVPTVEGKKFAQKYTGKQDYFVYTGW